MGYFAVQTTKPQTLGYSLADSPVGMLGWIYEKLVSCTDSYPWEDDEGMVTRSRIGIHLLDRAPANLGLAVLTWVSIYWFSLSGPASSIRIYYELSKVGQTATFPKTTVPVGISFFPKELVTFPRAYVPISCQVFSITI